MSGIVAFSFFSHFHFFDFYICSEMLLFSSQKSLLAFGRFSSSVPEVKLREVNLSVCVCRSVPRKVQVPRAWKEGRREGRKGTISDRLHQCLSHIPKETKHRLDLFFALTMKSDGKQT